MKRTITFLLSLLILTNMFCGLVYAADVSWADDASIIVTIYSDEKKVFTPADFPEIDCKDVWVIQKVEADPTAYNALYESTSVYHEDIFTYKLVLFLNDSDVNKAIEALKANPMVASASINTHKDTFDNSRHIKNVYMLLDPNVDSDGYNYKFCFDQTIRLTLGGATALGFSFNENSKHLEWRTIVFKLDPTIINEDELTKDSFAECGIYYFLPNLEETKGGKIVDDHASYNDEYAGKKSDSHLYYAMFDKPTIEIGELEAAANKLSRVPGVVYVDCVAFPQPTGAPFYQGEPYDKTNISIQDNTIVRGYGDSMYTITGLKEGRTELNYVCSGNDGWVRATCTIEVYTPTSELGDTNNDGKINSLDAAMVLKHDAGLRLSIENADVNKDGIVNSLDAAMILKLDAGIIKEFPVSK